MSDDRRISRRSLLKQGASLVPAAAVAPGVLAGNVPAGAAADPSAGTESGPTRLRQGERRVVVIGAGAFGGWTALHLLRRGARVTLCDTWGPGHSRASSGGESRVIRHTYGDRIYVDWVIRALELWRENQQRWGRLIYHESGVLWMAPEGDPYIDQAIPNLDAAGVEYESLTPDQIDARYPQINPEGIRTALYEPQAGYLLARRGCEAVVEAFIEEGGEYRQAACERVNATGGEMGEVFLSHGGGAVPGDAFVFALGPWLGQFFPEVGVGLIEPTRQEVYYFGTPADVDDYDAGNLPVWADSGGRFWYGIPGAERRGFKMADDEHGPSVDPTTQERQLTDAGIARARQYLAHRFPGLRDAPFIEGRVCQYENSPDGHFIIDRHPSAANVWLVGGGSGHGYKHGPALGEYVAGLVLDDGTPEAMFSLARFA